MDEEVTAEHITPGLWKDSRPTPHLWLVNGQWESDGRDDEIPYAIVFGGKEEKWHHFLTYTRENFVNMHGPNYTFRRIM